MASSVVDSKDKKIIDATDTQKKYLKYLKAKADSNSSPTGRNSLLDASKDLSKGTSLGFLASMAFKNKKAKAIAGIGTGVAVSALSALHRSNSKKRAAAAREYIAGIKTNRSKAYSKELNSGKGDYLGTRYV